MPRTQRVDDEIPFLDQILAVGDGAPPPERRAELARLARSASHDGGRRLDLLLLQRLATLAEGLASAQVAQQELRALMERLASPPWHPALFLRTVPTAVGPRAMVLYGGARRVVAAADDVDLATLAVGDEVYLGSEGNVLAGRSPYGAVQCGETASFDRLTADGRCVLRSRDEDVVVDAAATLDAAALECGDQVRWDRTAWLAFEKIGGSTARRFLVDEVPDVTPDMLGGQARSLDLLLAVLLAAITSPAKAKRYGLTGRRAVLMVGAPGCGKTLLARIAAAELRRRSGAACRFAVVKPAEWESPFVGETQQNIRRTFLELRKHDGPTVLFLDEIEAIGRIRGAAGSQHADKFLAALLAEMDGFTDRNAVAVIAATNRKDLVDPALLERLSDVEIAVARPDARGARDIFDIHLPGDVPVYAPDGTAADARRALIDAAVSRLYSPNGDNTLCTLRFRDGATRVVAARELASGRLVAQICGAACQSAFLRDERHGEAGLRLDDLEDAIADVLARLSTTLSPRNAHAHLTDLPWDADVVGVEPVVRRVARPHRYHHAA
jgi:hypothetical protein